MLGQAEDPLAVQPGAAEERRALLAQLVPLPPFSPLTLTGMACY